MSKTLGYIKEMDRLVGEIAEYYGEKFAVIIYVTPEGGESGENGNEGMSLLTDDGGDSGESSETQLIPVNISLKRLQNYHKTVWKVDIGINTGDESGEGNGNNSEEGKLHCYENVENSLSDNLNRLFAYTTNAVASEMILVKEDVEQGQMVKTEALGELHDLNGMKKALEDVRAILEADYDFGKSNSESVDEIIALLDEVREYIHMIVARAEVMTGMIMELDNAHSKVNQIYGELVLFSDGGDIVTRKYNVTPKSKSAIQEFNPPLSNTMDRIEGVVPDIISEQQNSLDMWNLVDSLDKSEIRYNKYLEKSYNELMELKKDVSDQYLSHEIEDIGNRVSDIAIDLTYAISETTNNKTFDTLVKIQQYLQFTAVGGLLPINIINAVATEDWKIPYREGYPESIERMEQQLEVIRQV